MYAKIFAQIFDSSIVENPELRFTFIDLLTLCDENGVVDMTHEAIARRTNRPIDIIRRTIQELESPDPRSRTPDDEGRRIRRLDEHRDWGWMIVNYARFRATTNETQRREKTRERVKRYRQKRLQKPKLNVTPCNAGNALRNAGNAFPYASASASAYNPVDELYRLYPRKKKKPQAIKAIKAALSRAEFDEIKKGLLRAIESDHRFKEAKFTPFPASWFNSDGWLDEHDSEKDNGNEPRRKFKEVLDFMSPEEIFPALADNPEKLAAEIQKLKES